METRKKPRADITMGARRQSAPIVFLLKGQSRVIVHGLDNLDIAGTSSLGNGSAKNLEFVHVLKGNPSSET
jgi:hypothetical protein